MHRHGLYLSAVARSVAMYYHVSRHHMRVPALLDQAVAERSVAPISDAMLRDTADPSLCRVSRLIPPLKVAQRVWLWGRSAMVPCLSGLEKEQLMALLSVRTHPQSQGVDSAALRKRHSLVQTAMRLQQAGERRVRMAMDRLEGLSGQEGLLGGARAGPGSGASDFDEPVSVRRRAGSSILSDGEPFSQDEVGLATRVEREAD